MHYIHICTIERRPTVYVCIFAHQPRHVRDHLPVVSIGTNRYCGRGLCSPTGESAQSVPALLGLPHLWDGLANRLHPYSATGFSSAPRRRCSGYLYFALYFLCPQDALLYRVYMEIVHAAWAIPCERQKETSTYAFRRGRMMLASIIVSYSKYFTCCNYFI